jgi:diaminopimelate decarboxylase
MQIFCHPHDKSKTKIVTIEKRSKTYGHIKKYFTQKKGLTKAAKLRFNETFNCAPRLPFFSRCRAARRFQRRAARQPPVAVEPACSVSNTPVCKIIRSLGLEKSRHNGYKNGSVDSKSAREQTMPISESFQNRLYPVLPEIADYFGTPFHIYDEAGIRDTARGLVDAFSQVDAFQEYFAVKALPNPSILSIMKDLGFGFDCSSVPELVLSRRAGASGEEIIFTSNNTTVEDFEAAIADGGSILNLDDVTLIEKLPTVPELICFRYNPGKRRSGNSIIGHPEEAKYGVSHDQIGDAYQRMISLGAKRFGLHTMLVSNELNHEYMVETTRMLLEMVEALSAQLGIHFEFINIGGGLGIPYHPDQEPLDIQAMGRKITALFDRFKSRNGSAPRLYMESGRYMTGPHGVLVTRAINRKDIYRKFIGVDACMSALMRPGMYGAYHHIDVPGKTPSDSSAETVDVVGSLCENIDKFAVQRRLPAIDAGDLLVIQDTGAHGHAMGFNYNAKLRPQELLLRCDGTVERVRRAETMDDYFATLDFEKAEMRPAAGKTSGAQA